MIPLPGSPDFEGSMITPSVLVLFIKVNGYCFPGVCKISLPANVDTNAQVFGSLHDVVSTLTIDSRVTMIE